MTKKLKLAVELIPASSWQNNLRSILKPRMWDEVRKDVYKKSNFKCSICKQKRKLQAHEIWKFNKRSKTQKLVDITALCYLCHMVKHIGFAQITAGKRLNERIIRHFMDINKCDRAVFQKHLQEKIKKFEDFSRYDWQLNLSGYKFLSSKTIEK